MSGELVAGWRQQILERHEVSQRADDELKKAILGKIEAVRVAGALISDCRDSLNERDFKQATDFLSLAAVRAYVRFAHANKAPVMDLHAGLHSIKIALQTSGALEFPGGHGAQQLHELGPNFFQKPLATSKPY